MSRAKFVAYADHTYHLNTERHYPLPLSPVGEQRSWQDNITNVIRRDIRALVCEEGRFVEGVRVRRTAAQSKQTYTIGRDKALYTLDEAVQKVIQILQDRERRMG